MQIKLIPSQMPLESWECISHLIACVMACMVWGSELESWCSIPEIWMIQTTQSWLWAFLIDGKLKLTVYLRLYIQASYYHYVEASSLCLCLCVLPLCVCVCVGKEIWTSIWTSICFVVFVLKSANHQLHFHVWSVYKNTQYITGRPFDWPIF